jgi:protein-tyrosine phosphatase
MPQVDIHCHLLPGIDDGAKSWEEMLAMAKMAVEDGTETIICTPHQLGSFTFRKGEEIRALVAEAQGVLDENGIDLKVLPGADVRIDSDMIARLRSGDCVTLGDHRKHVLLELPHELYLPLEPVLSQLASLRMVGILSHPERNQGILRQPDLLPGLVAAGCLMQVTAESVMGVFGSASRELSEWMLRQNLVHFLASDGHGPRRRKPLLSEGMRRVAEIVGEPTAVALCDTNPRAVAEGRSVNVLPSILKPSSTSWFSRWFARGAA